MEDRLPGSRPHVDDDTVIAPAAPRSDFGDELEHPLRFVRRELRDLVEARNMPFGQNQQMRLRCGLRSSIATKPSVFATWSPSR
jgi:hypothetical protein